MPTKPTQTARSQAYTLVEVLAALGIVAVLASLLLAALAGVRARGRRTACLSNVRQLGVALALYAQDDDATFPLRSEDGDGTREEWDDALLPYARNIGVFRCPDCPVPPAHVAEVGALGSVAAGYAFNFELSGATVGPRAAMSETTVPFPSTTVSFCEVAFRTGQRLNEVGTIVNTNAPDNGEDPASRETVFGPAGAVRHQGGGVYGFVDGHARWYRPDQVRAADSGPDGALRPNDGATPSFAR